MKPTIGYCTNVHAGVDLAAIQRNLVEYATAVRSRLQWDQLGVGLWIPDHASRELVSGGAEEFRRFLQTHRLNPYTINGFPFADFHGDRVKQRVYLPTWQDTERLEYTKRLATILAQLLPDDVQVGSISTLPIGWPNNAFAEAPDIDLDRAGSLLRDLSSFLASLERTTGKRIVVAIEPEPGCLIDTIDDMVSFFSQQLPETTHREYLTACHDICHSAVMNEPQHEVLSRYRQANIAIGKVQVSSAIVVDWETIDPRQRTSALTQLQGFAEDRYLHQTGQVGKDGGFQLASDLPQLINDCQEADLESVARWVIHFHVPIFLQQLGLLQTSRQAVEECLGALVDPEVGVSFTGHLEVETYAWTVLPEEMRQRGLAEDIASELAWLIERPGIEMA